MNAILREVNDKVIGEDFPVFKYIDHMVDDKKRKACNKLKKQQRAALAEISKRYNIGETK